MDLPTRSSHLFEQIHKILWDKIQNGEIVPSQRLKDTEWAKRLGVSRTPVREAMRKMQQEGILKLLENGGYEVRTISETDRREVYRCRAALESLAVRSAAENATPKATKPIKHLLQRAEQAIQNDDFDQVFALNAEFHRSLIELSGNSHLIRLCDSLSKLVFFYRIARLNRVKAGRTDKDAYRKHLRAEHKEHNAILVAVGRKEAERAAKLIEKHVLETVQEMDVTP